MCALIALSGIDFRLTFRGVNLKRSFHKLYLLVFGSYDEIDLLATSGGAQRELFSSSDPQSPILSPLLSAIFLLLP